MDKEEGIKKSKNLADVINGGSLIMDRGGGMKGFAILSLHLFAAINCSGAASFTAFVREEESSKTSIFGNPVSCYFD